MIEICNALGKFWRLHPALLYGLTSLIGAWGLIHPSLLIMIPLACLWIPLLISGFNQLVLSYLLILAIWGYGWTKYQFPNLPAEGIAGQAYIDIQGLTVQNTFFGKNWQYQCQIQAFFPSSGSASIAHSIPCQICLPFKNIFNRPPANRSYIVKGTLKQTSQGRYILKVKMDDRWDPIDGSWSFAEWRFQAKAAATKWIRGYFSDRKSAGFLSGLVTGDFDDRTMQFEFSRFGLQHIMAISGFHFAIIAAFLSFLFRLIFPPKLSAIVIIGCLTMYVMFLGNSSSILRAWVMIVLALAGQFFEKQGHALNALGIALLVIVAIDPWQSQSLGFQFSFLTTAAILLGNAPIDYIMTQILPKRSLSQMSEMNGLNQHGYCLLTFFRQGLALTIAVNLFAMPLTLYYFHQFPWMSLLYNLFFPFLVSIAMFFLILGLILPFGQIIHYVNDRYTQWILSLTYDMSPMVDRYYQVESVPEWLLVSYFCMILFGLIVIKQKLANKQKEKEDWAFI